MEVRMSTNSQGLAHRPVRTYKPRSFAFYFAFLWLALAVSWTFFAVMAVLKDEGDTAAMREASRTQVHLLRIAIDHELRSMVDMLELLSASTALAQGDLASFYIEAKKLAEIAGNMVVVLRDRDGQQLINTFHPWGTPLPKVQGPNQLHVLETKRLYISGLVDPVNAPVLKEYLFAIVMPLLEDGEVEATLSLGVNPNHIREVLARHQFKEGWIAVVGDREGTIIARTLNHEQSVGKKLPADFMQTVATAISGTWEGINFEGVPIYTSFEKSEEAGWVVSLGLTRERLYASLNRSRILLLVLVATVLSGTGYGAWLAFRTIGGAIYALRDQAASLGGGGRVVEALHTPLREINEVSAVVADASRKRALIDAELNHRVKNMLAKVQAVFSRLARGTRTKDEFANAALDRIQTMARVHDTLTKGVQGKMPLRQLLESELSVVGARNAELVGEGVMLPARTAENLAHIIHELVTNAAKYGAFSNEIGFVRVEWQMVDATLTIEWREFGGPPPKAKHTEGFGSTFIRASAEGINGEVSFDYTRAGLRCEIRIPHET
jgi:two-component sensor histidine kinase